VNLTNIEAALAAQHYETARRFCLAALKDSVADRNAVLHLLHRAYRALGDFAAALKTLEQIAGSERDTELLLLCAEDYALLSDEGFYRESAEKRAGLSIDEYVEKMRAVALENLAAATRAGLQGHEERAAQLFEMLGLPAHAASWKTAAPAQGRRDEAPPAMGRVAGVLRYPDGAPVVDALITLGLQLEVEAADPQTYLSTEMGYSPKIGAQQAQHSRTDANGNFRFEAVPAGRHEFLAVTLNGDERDINTHFFVHGVDVAPGEEAFSESTLHEWQSAPPLEIENPFPLTLQRDGVLWRRVHTETWNNPFHFEFPRQIVHWPLRASPATTFLLLDSTAPGESQPLQPNEDGVLFFSSLAPLSHKVLALYEAAGQVAKASASRLKIVDEGETLVIETGAAQFRLPGVEGARTLPPLLAVRGADKKWRGAGRFVLPDGIAVEKRSTRVLEEGPLQARIALEYSFSNGKSWTFELTAHEGEEYLLVHETAPAMEGAAFEFSLREFLEGENGARGFLHWTPEHGNRHWSTLQGDDCELARLQESVAWWIPPCGFGYAFTPDSLKERDYIGVFTIRRGEWKDALFEKLTNGPIDADGRENRELDWPFPEMIGSTVSMITAHTSSPLPQTGEKPEVRGGDAFFRWGAFEGERFYGVLASSLARNEGPHKEISRAQHKNSSPRLQEFRLWNLDAADCQERPHVVVRRDELQRLRSKRANPKFAPFWEVLEAGVESGKSGASAAGIVFAVEGDPLLAWRKKRELTSIAAIRSKMTLLGRDYSDMYSPVGARPITHLAEDYDLIAASGVFTPDEERLVRAFLLLMGHLYMAPDLMNWKYGSRNANFEADRVDVVGAVGLCFHGHPDAQLFLDHAVSLMERSLNVYCTPGSGKWYENPACYYLHASKCRCNLVFHLWRHGIYDASRLPRFKEFLRWGILLLTPPRPAAYDTMRDGCTPAAYSAAFKRRVIPPLGDHAELGRFVPEHYAFLSLLYREHDPQFADELLWAYQSGGLPGSDFGNVPVLFAVLEESDLKPVPAPDLKSRRLEGFGAVLRGHFEKPGELYVLWKQGPGGYRYQRSEGSFIFFANGVPLVYEGGEAGETWRHSTLSFYDVHTPLAPGHVTQFHARDGFEWVQGVHPKVLAPGEPVYLSDDCNHHLVEEAWRRFAQTEFADMRTLCRVGDEYLVVHDELNLAPEILAHWHLHVVAESETYDDEFGYIFKGRFGTDLQVLLPGQKFEQTAIRNLPIYEYHKPASQCFATRHLQLSRHAPPFYLAILRPLFGKRKPLSAALDEGRIGSVRIHCDTRVDYLSFSRAGVELRSDL
jgi:hypothetical protein